MTAPRIVRLAASLGEKKPAPGDPVPAYVAALNAAAPQTIVPTGDARLDRLLLHGIATAKSLQVPEPAGVTMNWLLPWRIEHEVDPANPGTWLTLGTALLYSGSVGGSDLYISIAFS